MNSTPLKLAMLAGLGLAASMSLYAPPATAAARISIDTGIDIGVAPPPPQFERVPPARRGFVWATGYWRWDRAAHRHMWIGGHWIRVRPGYRYHPAYWVRHGHHWRFHDGYWSR